MNLLKWSVIWVSVSTIVIGLWFLLWALISRELGNPKDAGSFGDMFGAVNALFSGLAFAGIIVAIMMQREDLKLQQEELTGSRKAQEAQVKALVIAAQINAQVTVLQNLDVLQQLEQEVGEPPTQSGDLLGEIFGLTSELRELKGHQ